MIQYELYMCFGCQKSNAILSCISWIKSSQTKEVFCSALFTPHLQYWVSRNNQDMRGFRTRSCKKCLKEMERRDSRRDDGYTQISGLKDLHVTCSLSSQRNNQDQWVWTTGKRFQLVWQLLVTRTPKCGESFSKGRECPVLEVFKGRLDEHLEEIQ